MIRAVKKVKLDSRVELNAENNWSASFEDLPSKCVSNGEVEDCHYIVEEETLEGWKGSSSTEYDKENKTYHITLTNAPIQYGSLIGFQRGHRKRRQRKSVHV